MRPVKALVIGRGSMGQRRIRDLKALGVDVESWDVTDGKMTEKHYQGRAAAVISTPPLTKGEYVQWAMLSNGFTHVFTEADVETFHHDHLPSATPRFNPSILRIKERIAAGSIGTPVAYTLHVGQHLLDWHPGADLNAQTRTGYSYYAAKRETGACREMVPFELGWLTWLFGPVTKAKALRGSLAGIADIDDVYQVVVEHQVKGSAPVLGHLLIDAVSRPAYRVVTVIGTQGSFIQQIRYTEAVYLAEMRAFVASVETGAPWPYSLAEEAANLAVLADIEKWS